jgi:hypothetical protein
MGPRDAPIVGAVPVNYETGQPLTEAQRARIGRIADAVEALRKEMHDAEGSAMPGEHQDHVFVSRRMNIAATHLETALMYARKAALEAK